GAVDAVPVVAHASVDGRQPRRLLGRAGTGHPNGGDPHGGTVAPHLVVVPAAEGRAQPSPEVDHRADLAETALLELLLVDQGLGPLPGDILRLQLFAVL